MEDMVKAMAAAMDPMVVMIMDMADMGVMVDMGATVMITMAMATVDIMAAKGTTGRANVGGSRRGTTHTEGGGRRDYNQTCNGTSY